MWCDKYDLYKELVFVSSPNSILILVILFFMSDNINFTFAGLHILVVIIVGIFLIAVTPNVFFNNSIVSSVGSVANLFFNSLHTLPSTAWKLPGDWNFVLLSFIIRYSPKILSIFIFSYVLLSGSVVSTSMFFTLTLFSKPMLFSLTL